MAVDAGLTRVRGGLPADLAMEIFPNGLSLNVLLNFTNEKGARRSLAEGRRNFQTPAPGPFEIGCDRARDGSAPWFAVRAIVMYEGCD
jgi:hypothetical protein